MIAVSNASPLINISRLKLFHHLPTLYEKLAIPEAVVKEVVEKGKGRTGAIEVLDGLKSGFIEKKRVDNALAVSALSNKAIKHGFRISVEFQLYSSPQFQIYSPLFPC